ncbi:MAG: hypothetical protein HQL37_07285 [Alphaproteobacteria bacterium]|nr:hypothetical protein [Alphaproteobacteria bacterium]
MSTLYVARSAKLCKWGADVGLGKNLFKVGCVDGDAAVESLIKDGWAGETDWTLVKSQEIEHPMDEETVLAKLGRKGKAIDPMLYPRLKGTVGIFKVSPTDVENHLLIAQALANRDISKIKVKPVDFGTFLIHNALK